MPESFAWLDLVHCPLLRHGLIWRMAMFTSLPLLALSLIRNTAWLADGHLKCWMRIRNGTVCTLLVMVGLMWLP